MGTMRILMTKVSAGPAGVRQVGDVVDVSPEEASALVADGAAVALDPPTLLSDAPAETATVAPRETATAKPQRGKRGG